MIDVAWAAIPLRLAIGIIFLYHGYHKLFVNLKKTVKFVSSVGFKPGKVWAIVLGSTEYFGGIFLILGFLSKIATSLLMVVMLVALYFHIFKWRTSFSGTKQTGWEFDLILLAALIALFIFGPGIYSIDQLIF